MAFTDEFAEALGEIIKDPSIIPPDSNSFTWNDGSYLCVATGFNQAGELGNGGWDAEKGGVIDVIGSDFGGAKPERGQTLVFRTVTYRISEVLTAPGDAFLRLTCVNAAKGA